MFPYHDENEALRTPVVTIGVIATCIIVWVLVQGAGSETPLAASVCDFGLIPGELMGTLRPGSGFRVTEDLVCLIDSGPQYLNVLTSMFMHGGWMHLLGNMWFLWLFGNNIEDSMSRPRCIAFYLLCGLAAALAQVFADAESGIPMVGASGAISGVMGAYLVLFPRVRVFTMVPLGFMLTSVALPAWAMLLYWMVLQFVGGLGSIGGKEGGVAFWAHIGGFVAGVVLVKLFAHRGHLSAHRHTQWRPRHEGFSRE